MPRDHGAGALNSDHFYAQGKRGCAKRPGRPGALETGGDLTFSWKEGHICTVVLLEVLSQLCHGGGGVQALSVVGGRQSRTRV